VENAGLFGFDEEDRDGFFVGTPLRPIGIDRPELCNWNPSSAGACRPGQQTNSYRCQELRRGPRLFEQDGANWGICSAGGPASTCPYWARRRGSTSISRFNRGTFRNGTRSWGMRPARLKLTLLGDTVARCLPAYRFRILNGSLGEQGCYSALEAPWNSRGPCRILGRLGEQLISGGSRQANYRSKNSSKTANESDNFAQLLARTMPSAPSTAPSTLARAKTLPLTPMAPCAIRPCRSCRA